MKKQNVPEGMRTHQQDPPKGLNMKMRWVLTVLGVGLVLHGLPVAFPVFVDIWTRLNERHKDQLLTSLLTLGVAVVGGYVAFRLNRDKDQLTEYRRALREAYVEWAAAYSEWITVNLLCLQSEVARHEMHRDVKESVNAG